MSLGYLNEDGKITKAAYMPFKIEHIDHLTLKVLTKLNSNEKMAVDAIVYWTKATD